MNKTSRLAGVAVVAVMAASSGASAQEVRASLRGGATVPAGGAGTRVIAVERSEVLGTSYAVVRSRDPNAPTRCAFAAERVAAWGRINGAWTEMASEVIDRCPTGRGRSAAKLVRARVVEWHPSGAPAAEFHIRAFDPSELPADAPLTRFRLEGDRFVGAGAEQTLAAPIGEAARVTLRDLAVSVDGELGEWQGVAPYFETRSAEGGSASVYLSAHGSRLRFAARIARSGEGAPSLRLHLAAPGISTAVLHGNRANPGRVLELHCGWTTPADASMRCREVDGAVVMEGETDLGTMLWSDRRVGSVAAMAQVVWGERVASSDLGGRLHVVGLPSSFDVLEGASETASAQCTGGYVGRVRASAHVGMEGMITCGASCQGGTCERTFGASGASTRVALNGERNCLTLAGAGGDEAGACGASPMRLVGSVPARGYDLVVAVERSEASGERRGEMWALVTASARWQRIWSGAARPASTVVASLHFDGAHPRLCHASACEVVDSITMAAEDRGGVTTGVNRLLQNVGLRARRHSSGG